MRAGGRPIPLAVFLAIAEPMLSALDATHRLTDEGGKPMHVVHRDPTPANVMVTEKSTVKLLDFGIATGGKRLYRTATGARARDLALYEPKAGKGRARRSAQRRVLGRGDLVRAAHWRTGLRRGHA